MNITLTTFHPSEVKKAAEEILIGLPHLVEIGPRLGNGSGYTTVRIVAEKCPYSDAEMGFKIGMKVKSIN